MKKNKLLLAAAALMLGGSVWAQTNIIENWDGGDDTSSPSNFGWTSSAGTTLQPRNNNGGIRMTTTYSGYKLENGTSYSYSDSSDPSSVIFWVRYKSSGESFTYTFQGLEPNYYYDFSGLVGWHNNESNPTFTIKINDGTSDLATMSKAVSTRQTLYSINSRFKTPSTITNTTDIKIVFTCNKTGDCMEAISALSLVNVVVKNDLQKAISYATQVNTKLSNATLTSSISTAQGIYDNASATQSDVNSAETTLRSAINTAIASAELNPEGENVSAFIFQPGFEGLTVQTGNYATANGIDYTNEGWTLTTTGGYGFGAAFAYNESGQINGATIPSADNNSNTGKALGISVGWNTSQIYQSEPVQLPAGSYTLKVYAYNAGTATDMTSKVGFVPTSAEPILSTKTSYTLNNWDTDEVSFTLDAATVGRFQIGGTAGNNTSTNHGKVFFDNLTLTFFDPLKLAQIQWQEVWDALDALEETALPDAAETAITDALAETEPTTVDGYNTAKDALQALIDSYDGIKAAYDKVNALITLATSEKDNSTGDKTDFATAISTATSNIETRTAADDLTSDYSTLETARQTYVTSGAQPTADHVFDYTFKIPDAAVTSATDWTNKRTNSGQQYTDAPDNTYFDTYNENRNIQKNIGTLRLGKYELKAATRSEASVTVGNIYVSQNAANLNQTDIHHDGNTGGDLGNGWSWTSVAFDNYVDDKDITLGFYSECGSSKWAGADDFHLYYKGNVVDNETAEALKRTVVSGKMNATVASTQSSALSAFESAQTFENYNALKSAIDAASNSKAVYETLDVAITNAESWTTNATSVTDPMRLKYNNGTYSDETTANDIYAEYQAAEITALTAASASNWTSAIINASFETGDMAGWTAESRNDTGVKDQSNATYSITSGDAVDGLKLFNSWGGTAENNVYQTIKNLPAGTYTLAAVLAGFKGESLVIAANSETGNTVVDGDKTVGYLTTVTFTLADAADVIIKASNTKDGENANSDKSFIKADNFQLYVGSSVPASAYKPNLLYAINNATNARKSANEGTGVFQIPEDAGTALAGAITTAQGVYDNASATLEQINQAITDIDAARTTYEGTELNGPTDGKSYCIKVATAEHDKFGNAVVVALGSTSASNPTGYTYNASAAPEAYLAQAFTFTQVTGNTYKISIEMPEGTVYLTNGTKNGSTAGWKDAQIQGTTDAGKAMEFTIEAADVANTFYIYNTETNSTIACQNAGNLYTEPGNAYFTVAEASQASVELSIGAKKLATRIFPFTPTLPDGVAAYTCEEHEGTSLTLVKDDSPKANTPYILYSESGCSSTDLEGWGSASADTYTVGYLTGVFTRTEVPEGSYVLQTHGEDQAFYMVNQTGAYSSAYRVYVTVPAAGVKSFSFTIDDVETAIEAARAEGENTVTLRYNVAGQQMQNEHKGLNIIKMEDGSVRKVLVK